MNPLHRKALIGTMQTLVMLAAAIFVPVLTLRYWQGWLCLALFFVPAGAMALWLLKHDPALLERRMKAGPKEEKRRGHKLLQILFTTLFPADFALSALDHRLGWSRVPVPVVLLGGLMMLAGMAVSFSVARANSYASAVIEIAENQKVISDGPYAVVRHPLYAGSLLWLFGIPLALGSWWGLLVNVPMLAAIVWRLLDEEKFLVEKLPGYVDYLESVRYRLAPFIW